MATCASIGCSPVSAASSPSARRATVSTRSATGVKRLSPVGVGSFGKPAAALSRLRGNTVVVRAADAEGALDPEEIEMDAEERMDKSIKSIQENFNTVRTGRANPSILDRIEVEYYGAMTPLKTIANATTPDAQTIVIQPFDKSAINNIERAIMMSDLGLTPGNDGNVIRLNIPQLTSERRKDLAKLVSKLGEDGKVALRNVRRDAMKSIGKLKEISEDEIKTLEESIDKLTAGYVKQVDELIKKKEDEVKQV